MPRKVKEMIRDLIRAGFIDRGGKGSHRNFRHPSGIHITLSGSAGEDVKPYQEKALAKAMKEVKK